MSERSVRSRSYLGIQHLQGAEALASRARTIENQIASGRRAFVSSDRAGAVSGAIMLATAFLEGTINEFFSDASDRVIALVRQIPPDRQPTFAVLWKRGIPRTARYGILEKYQLAVELLGKPALEEGEQAFQNARLLIDLRNSLVHYEPDWVVTEAGPTSERQLQQLEKRLKGKFELCAWTAEDALFFPERCLSAGCAEWATRSAVTFAQSFFDRIGARSTIEELRDWQRTAREQLSHGRSEPSAD